jgi:hypothetical protein
MVFYLTQKTPPFFIITYNLMLDKYGYNGYNGYNAIKQRRFQSCPVVLRSC